MKLLLRMRHGLGDNCQFTIVLRHIRHYFPNWIIDMEIGTGKESYFKQSVNKTFRRKYEFYDPRNYDNILDVHWPVPEKCSPDLPSSKPTRFLQKVLKVEPIEEFYKGYDIIITDKENGLVDDYVRKLPKPFVLIHYMAKTLKHRKSLGHNDAAFICLQILKAGLTPVILDWKKESPIPDQINIFNPGTNDPVWEGNSLASAGTIAALIGRAKLYIGIDSGPLHIAGCTKTPTIGIWHGHHPINFFDLCDNVTHLVPNASRKNKYIKGSGKTKARTYFEKNYNHFYYRNLSKQLLECMKLKLGV